MIKFGWKAGTEQFRPEKLLDCALHSPVSMAMH